MKYLLLIVLCALMTNGEALAQTTGMAGIEGYVTDATGKPLQNVFVEIRFYIDPNGAAGVTGALTDTSGFYIMETAPQTSSFGVAMFATCRTSKGLVSTSQRMYWTVRDQIYRRDFRLTLPKKVTGCL